MIQLECGYQNRSDRMVILRCTGPNRFFLERVVFPMEVLAFEAPSEADVEIWCHSLGGPEMLERFSAEDLAPISSSTSRNSGSVSPDQAWPQSA